MYQVENIIWIGQDMQQNERVRLRKNIDRLYIRTVKGSFGWAWSFLCLNIHECAKIKKHNFNDKKKHFLKQFPEILQEALKECLGMIK